MNHARKRFGQHFLEPAWIDKVIDAIGPERDQVFLEIGPGRGALTRPLAARAKQVVACEIDRDLAAELQRAAISNVTIVEGDFLRLPDEQLWRELRATSAERTPVRVAGNLPYNVGAPILFRLLALFATGAPLVDATVMLQRDVVDRLIAKPGTGDYGVLSILIGHSAAVERLLVLPPGAFRPAPKVYSAVVRLVFHPSAPPVENPEMFAKMVQAIFTRRRKTLANALDAFPLSQACPPTEVLRRVGLDGRRRPETLSIAELVAVADGFSHWAVPPPEG